MEIDIPFHPVIGAWFANTFGQPTDVQIRSWNQIRAGEHTLIAAPTGSGKTLAALLPCLDRIIRCKAGNEEGGKSSRGVKVLYVTPLKALNNDIHHHLFRFAAEMSGTAKETGIVWSGLSIGVRTGDTTQSTRASMLRNPPDLLITTPESLYLMLTSRKSREILRTVEQVVVDEIHHLASDKRGVHLSISLERLTGLCGRNLQRIGVSATQKPLSRVARFLGGWEEGEEAAARPVSVVESAMDKSFHVRVTMPDRGVRALDKEAVWTPLVERLLQLMEGTRSVLIFVNNRRLCERLTLRLNDYTGYEMARSHHGSISREKRLEVESLLKGGELRCLIATGTLELGIDVGHVDLVFQIDSPREAAAGIQRIGRAGHSVGDESRGVIAVRGRGDLAEAAVLAKAIAARDIEEIRIPQWSLDVLAQHTVAALAADDWTPEGLYSLFAGSDCFHGFPRERFRAMLNVLSGFFPFVRPLIGWDRESGLLHNLPVTPMAASMGAGTIPQSSSYPVHHAESRLHLGELDEEFVHESRVGDVFQLGASSWVIRSIRPDRVYVTESANSFSEIPFWRAEAGGRSVELGLRIGSLLAAIRSAGRDAAAAASMRIRLMDEYKLDENAASELMAYVRGQDVVCLVPTDTLIVAEHYKDDSNRHHLVIHSLFGRRINRTWEMALRARFETVCSLPVYSAAKDDGIEFVFPEWDGAWLSELQSLSAEQVERLLWEALPGTSMFGKAFREIAETSLLLTRGYERQPSWKIRFRSEELLKAALPYADRFPFLREAYTACLEGYLDVPGLLALLESVREGRIHLHFADSLAPSPFAVRFMNDYAMTALYESDALGKDVQLRLLNISRGLAAEWFGPDGLRSLISPDTLASVQTRLEQPVWMINQEAGGETILRLLKEQGDLTEAEAARVYGDGTLEVLEQLEAAGSVRRVRYASEERWICRDEAEWYVAFPEDGAAVSFILKRFADRRMSFSPDDIRERYGLDRTQVRALLQQWKEEGFLERAPFAEANETELYSTARVAERIVRAAVTEFRQRHEAVDPVRYASWLLSVHRLQPRVRLFGAEGVIASVRQLQGLFLPLSHWESILFPSRVADYRKEMLDQLCAAGEIFWIGRKAGGEKEGRIAFFLAEDKTMAAPYIRLASAAAEPSKQPELLSLLKRNGASFLTALARETGTLPSELLPQLLELVWEGRLSNDLFAPLRTPAAIKGTAGKAGNFQSGLGRWYALAPETEEADETEADVLGCCKHWIGSFGILTRSVASLGIPYPWDRLADMLKRLEEWGMVTRGFFVRSIPAMQFSTREQVELLQAPPDERTGQPVLVSAVDPANPFGAWIDWPDIPGVKFSRKPGNFLTYDGGRWLLWVENYGEAYCGYARRKRVGG